MKSANVLIKDGHVVDPVNRVDRAVDVLIQDGRIAAIGPGLKAQNGTQLMDAAGCYVLPGLIDLHTHLRQPGREDKETIATGVAAAAKGGFTQILSMANTDPVADTRSVIEFIRQEAARIGSSRVHPVAAVTKGLRGEQLTEMAELAESGAVAFSDDGKPVATAEIMRRALEYASMLDKPIIDHCEDLTLTEGGIMNEGVTAMILGLRGMPVEAETIIAARDIQLARLSGGHVHLAHVSAAGTVELVRQAKAQGVRVTAEAAPHHLALTEEAVRELGSYAKMNPPLRTGADVAALIAGLRDGTIDAIATDHAPHASWEKAVEMEFAPFGVIGLETVLSLAIKLLIEPGHLTWSQLVERLSASPARIARLTGGSLAVGQPADAVIVDPQARWQVAEETLVSKSCNSPFVGWELPGVVRATLLDGRAIYQAQPVASGKGRRKL